MSSRRKRILITVLAMGLAGIVVCGALLHERFLDALYAWRTGYFFEWMPEGVVPANRRAMNNAGQVAVNLFEDGHNTKAALWSIDEPRVQLLAPLPAGRTYSVAMAIGEDGSIVGVFTGPDGGFISNERAGMVEISHPGSRACCATGVNRKGEVAGVAFGEGIRGFRWTRDSGAAFLEQLPGTQGSLVYGINDEGWVVGGIEDRPVLWAAGTPRDLGLPPGYHAGTALAINSRSRILVACRPRTAGPDTGVHPYIWSEDSGYDALPIPEGCTELEPLGLDNAGRVLLRARRSEDGAPNAFLLTEGECKPLPPARLGLSTIYVGLNDRGWLTGCVVLRETEEVDVPARRGFVARP